MGVEITGKTLGVIGCGNIGSIVADRALGLHMKVIAYDPFLSPERARATSASRRSSSTNCSSAPISSRCIRRSPTRPRNIIDAAALAKTKKGVRIINCARGGLVDEHALADALNSGHVAGAAFDVFVEEPANARPAVFGHAQRDLHAASRRRHHRGAGERRAAGRRADVGLSVCAAPSPTRSTSPRSPPRRRRSSSRSSRSPKSSARSPAN